ncbi:uncharacterized protein N7503_007586 [Penicillium pulvis]|uniref:uncharacterized protein n=1 Tax=Penicillium pulvis TaxID=1562058 RepID=UPI00254783B1|nr:uncharacterized protein N7503_007586 [Penicillium pulvis]KAJ5798290.1 hypothetical protein N7503_007586 [Penicillium pulvis]
MNTPNEFSQWDEFSDASPPPSPYSGDECDHSKTIKYSSCTAKQPASKDLEESFFQSSEKKYRSDMYNALKSYEESFDQVRLMKRVLCRDGT